MHTLPLRFQAILLLKEENELTKEKEDGFKCRNSNCAIYHAYGNANYLHHSGTYCKSKPCKALNYQRWKIVLHPDAYNFCTLDKSDDK